MNEEEVEQWEEGRSHQQHSWKDRDKNATKDNEREKSMTEPLNFK